MRFDRLLLSAAACALLAGAAVAQTTSTSSTTTTRTQGSAQGPATAQPGAAAGYQGGAMATQPGSTTTSTTNTTGMSTGSQSGMTGGATAAVATGGPFQPITPAAGSNIVAVLQASGQFTTLLKAVTATNLTSVLQQPGALTVFAPTDAAFAALPPAQVAALMQPANVNQLQQLILLHVVNTPLSSAQLLNHSSTNVPTAATGKTVHLDGSTGTLKVDGQAVLQSDVKASNGTVFVVGQVLSPSYTPPAAGSEATTAAAATDASATPAATKATTTKSTSTKKHKK